jgi:RsiW-degrading membrane proteinase PrsW (M82 family)
MMNAYILLAALAPILILLFYIYRKDKNQPEPAKEMIKAFFYGVASALLSSTASTSRLG